MKTILLTLIMGISYLGYAQYPVFAFEVVERKRYGNSGSVLTETFPILEVSDSIIIVHTRQVDTLFVGKYEIPEMGNKSQEFEGVTKCFALPAKKCSLQITTFEDKRKFRIKFKTEEGWEMHYYVMTLLEKDLGWSSGR